ncbi:uncharacterized protein LOC141938713 isoform X2 [Strix uralensis]|uniref:uncharacterized protein LOC141935957 isoform X1 n=1 Tax=Strix uralensis TaxID=36305 RepID=UPI003DA2DE9B
MTEDLAARDPAGLVTDCLIPESADGLCPIQQRALADSSKTDGTSGHRSRDGSGKAGKANLSQCNSLVCLYPSEGLSVSWCSRCSTPCIFLIRGDRAWGGRPSKLNGGPRSLGRLTVLTPGITERHKELRQERNMHRCAENCDGRVTLWNPGQIIASSLFAPGVAAAAALKKWTGWGVG